MTDDAVAAQPLSRRTATLLALAGTIAFCVFIALGVWQVQRLAWKLDLIAQVEHQLSAPPVAAPGPADWPQLSREDAYRRVRIEGRFDHGRETCAQAVTELGPGCWVMTPMQTTAGWWLLVNRGFVDASHRRPATRAAAQIGGTVTLEGLLRLSEPGGGFLRHNDPGADRWYSRDVKAIAAARGLSAMPVAPYFVDAAGTIPGGPVGGLTVVRFHNNHLVYALTWFALAGLVLLAAVRMVRAERQWRQSGSQSP